MTSSDRTEAAAYRAKVFRWAKEAGLVQCRLVIYQPKADGITERVMSLDELEAFAVELEANARRVVQADAEHAVLPFERWWPVHLNPDPNDVDCAWCRAMPTCPSFQGKLQRAAAAEFSKIEEDGQVVADPATLDPVSLSTAMKCVPLMEAWLKSVRAEVERRLMAGTSVADFGLELGRQGNREFSDPEEVERMLRKQFRLTLEDVFVMKLKSPTQIERLTKGEKQDDGTVAAPVLGTGQWSKLSKLITRSDPKPSVKPLSAIKNPWVSPTISADEFKSVDDASDLA